MANAIFPGSFNPFTIGHKSIIDRALPLFDKIYIAVGYNEQKSTTPPPLDRVREIAAVYEGNPKVEACAYSGLTVEFAAGHDISFIIRGIRNSIDFEYEKGMADINRRIGNIETIFIPTVPELSDISSSVVRELSHNGYDITPFIP